MKDIQKYLFKNKVYDSKERHPKMKLGTLTQQGGGGCLTTKFGFPHSLSFLFMKVKPMSHLLKLPP